MELLFDNPAYDRLEVDGLYSHGFAASIVTLYRSRLQLLRAARDEKDLFAMQCLRFRPLNTRRQYSICLNNQYCLIVELQQTPNGLVLRIMEVRIYEI